MPATTDELAYARSWIQPSETDDEFNERVDRLERGGGYDSDRDLLINDSIAESMRQQLTVMLSQPGSASVGNVSYANSTNIQELSKNLAKLGALTPTGAEAEMARLVRPRRR